MGLSVAGLTSENGTSRQTESFSRFDGEPCVLCDTVRRHLIDAFYYPAQAELDEWGFIPLGTEARGPTSIGPLGMMLDPLHTLPTEKSSGTYIAYRFRKLWVWIGGADALKDIRMRQQRDDYEVYTDNLELGMESLMFRFPKPATGIITDDWTTESQFWLRCAWCKCGFDVFKPASRPCSEPSCKSRHIQIRSARYERRCSDSHIPAWISQCQTDHKAYGCGVETDQLPSRLIDIGKRPGSAPRLVLTRDLPAFPRVSKSRNRYVALS